MSTVRQGIERFLESQIADSKFLISRYSTNLETQVMVYPGHEENESGVGWAGDGQTWADHRWPHNSNTTPSYKDRTLTYSPGEHCKAIGTSWWNWVDGTSIGIGLDIDTEESHAVTTTTVTPEQLDEIIEKLKQLSYVTLVRSKSGQGIHIYVFFNEYDLPLASNHNEHKKHAVATLAKMCRDMDYDLSQHVDAKGSIFWLWAAEIGDGGFELLKDCTKPIGAADLVEFYDTQFDTRSGKSLTGYNSQGLEVTESDDGLDEQRYTLDDEHKAILMELEDAPFEKVWIPEHNMLQTSTAALEQLFDRRREAGDPLKGLFRTTASGKDAKRNCYITPRENGSFKVTRFGGAVSEHDLWEEVDGKTVCYFNQPLSNLTLLKRFASKVTQANKMTFQPEMLAQILRAMEHEMPEDLIGDTPIAVTLNGDGTYTAKCPDWEVDWQLPLVHSPDERSGYTTIDIELADRHVRHLMSETGICLGFTLKWKGGWIWPAKDSIALNRLQEVFGQAADSVRNQVVENSWTVTDHPFQDEYPGDRVWNKDTVRFRVPPSDKPGPHPHWDLILDHLGTSLNHVVRTTEWCQRWGLQTGADYLRAWVSCVVKHPFDPLPYLFFFGKQETGKSMFHEMLKTIFTGGVDRANGAMTSQSEFNGEIARSIVCYIEEMDLSKRKGTYEKIKELTTARTIFVHNKGQTPYPQRNKCHFCQMGNSATDCPVEEGDRRIVVIEVPRIEKEIGKNRLERELTKEAAFFLRTLLDIDLPEPINRLRLPILDTDAKQDLEVSNRSDVHQIMAEMLKPCDGRSVKVSDAYNSYKLKCAERKIIPESSATFRAKLSPTWVVGKGAGNVQHIANVTIGNERPKSKPLKLNEKGRLSTR